MTQHQWETPIQRLIEWAKQECVGGEMCRLHGEAQDEYDRLLSAQG